VRSIIASAAAIAFATVLAGCNDIDYIRQGIGSNLATPELPEVTNIQEIYIGEICRQAGLPVSQLGDILICNDSTMRPAEWAMFVQAGMNDIDRRCDAYLTWLDNKRRWREPVLSEIASAAADTAAILGLTKVGGTPISIVGVAFGFAKETFINFNSRLITEIDHSVVQTVVLDHQNRFRAEVAKVLIDNRPAAIYLLRNYLRICMPFSIEMSINNTITTFHRGGPEALRETPMLERAPIVAARVAARVATVTTPRTGVVIRANRPAPETPPVAQVMGGATTPVEQTLSFGSGTGLQRALCVDETGTFDPKTRTALRDFNAASLYPNDSAATDTIATDADLSRLRRAQRLFPSCMNAGFRNAYEVGLFARFGVAKMRGDLKLALDVAGIATPSGLTGSGTRAADDSVRQAIGNLRMKYNLPGAPVFDRTFYDTMFNNLAR
jgi:hypothetical protein